MRKNNFKENRNYFLVDFLFDLIKKHLKILNIEIITSKRIGDPKVGRSTVLFLKEVKILLKLISIFIILNKNKNAYWKKFKSIL